jgi:hypothetical protein
MEGAADPGPPPHTASAPPRRVRAWNPLADLAHDARLHRAADGRCRGSRHARSPGSCRVRAWIPLARSLHALTVEAPLSTTLARPPPASPSVTGTPAAPPPSDAPTTPPSPCPLSLPQRDAPPCHGALASAPRQPLAPALACPRPRSPTISATTSLPLHN